MNAPAPSRRYCSYCGAAFASQIDKCPRDGADLYAAAWDPLLGQVLGGRYRLVESLGGGGMGEVYRAVHVTIDKSFAVKVMLGEVAADRGMVERFHREARSLSRLSHRNVVSVTDFGQTERGLLYLVTEFVGGRSLAVDLERGAFTERRAADVTRQVARALGHAHQRGVVHRDLKPDNVIMVVEDLDSEVAKVLDFGIARVVGEEGPAARHHLTTAGLVIGTPAYMSPEQARGEQADSRADLYSLGVMLYEFLAGGLPFDGGSPVELLAAHLTAAPKPIRRLDVSPGLVAIAMRLLEKQPARRFAEASDVVRAIDEVERTGLAVRPTAPQWAATPPEEEAPPPAHVEAPPVPDGPPSPPKVVVEPALAAEAAVVDGGWREEPSAPHPMPMPPEAGSGPVAMAPSNDARESSAPRPMPMAPAATTLVDPPADPGGDEAGPVVPQRTTTPHPAPPAPVPAGATLLGVGMPPMLAAAIAEKTQAAQAGPPPSLGVLAPPMAQSPVATPWPGPQHHDRMRTDTGAIAPWGPRKGGNRTLRFAAAGALTGLGIGLIVVFAGRGGSERSSAAGDAGPPVVAAAVGTVATTVGSGTVATPSAAVDAGAKVAVPSVIPSPADAAAVVVKPVAAPDAGAAAVVTATPTPTPKPPDAGTGVGTGAGAGAVPVGAVVGEVAVVRPEPAVPTATQLRKRLERAGQRLDDLARHGKDVGVLRRTWLDLVGELAALDTAAPARAALDRRIRKLESAIRAVR